VSTYTQQQRLLQVTTPLGPDALLLKSFSGSESLSHLFRFQLDMLAEKEKPVAFDQVLGQGVTVRLSLPNEEERYFNGIVSRFSHANRDETFIHYRAEMVPKFWLLTKRHRSRIFQHMTVPDILKKVLDGLSVTFEIQGAFDERDYCVQYRESDFDFASRLMEEEGIYYFFNHTADKHNLVLGNTPSSHPDLPGDAAIIYEEIAGGTRDEERISEWEKIQELRSGAYTLWDHCFELPHKNLAAQKTILDGVAVGKVNHKLKLGGNDQLEIYDYPGEYAQRFDGIDQGGAERSSELQKIFNDNDRTVGIRMQQEALPSLLIRGAANCRQFVSGHKFNLTRHFNADGKYVLTSVSHDARDEGYRSQHAIDVTTHYSNTFTCIPFGLPFRPVRETRKPTVHGSQTAVVVGPAGDEIFTDKYGRVKVQFHWDREGRNDQDSSCWVRVATPWAGQKWGMIHIPRIEQEVVVDFLEGDPDQPIILGGVYNATMMPPYDLPANKTQSGIHSRSSLGGSGFNEIRFEDKKSQEEIFVHAQKDLNTVVEEKETRKVSKSRETTIHVDDTRTVETGNYFLTVSQGNRSVEISQGNDQLQVKAGNITTKAPAGASELDAMTVQVNGTSTIKLVCGASTIEMTPAMITITSPMIKLNS
jgi:type VI secretion system secreted protein VgrG